MQNKYNRVTNVKIIEGARLCYKYGYWSSQVNNYLDKFTDKARMKVSQALYNVYGVNKINIESAQYYDLFNSLGLVIGAYDDSIVSSKAQQEEDKRWILYEGRKTEPLINKCTRERIIEDLVGII